MSRVRHPLEFRAERENRELTAEERARVDADRPLSVAEVLALPPPTPEELARRREILEGVRAVRTRVQERLGRYLTYEELDCARRGADEEREIAGASPK